MKRIHRIQTRQSPWMVLAAALSGFCLHVGVSLAQEPAPPGLSHPPSQFVASESITDLHQALELLTRSAAEPLEQRRQRRARRLQSALGRFSKKSANISNDRSLHLGHNLPTATKLDAGNALSPLASRLVSAQQRLTQAQAIYTVSDINDLRRAMRRFDVVTENVVSDTFATVLLGLSDMTPTLSDDLMHPRVAKEDLRERIVDARLATTAAETSLPVIGHVGSTFSAARQFQSETMRSDAVSSDISLSVDSQEMAGLDGPVDEVALSDMTADPNRTWIDADATEGRYAMNDAPHLDEIELDELGGGTIASLDGAVATDDLQETRAGFVLPNGVIVDFAVTRLTSVDGIDELHTVANLPTGLNSKTLSQISARGFNTQVLSPASGGSMFTLIQNDLDNQVIRDVTFIDVGLKNTGVKARDLLPPSFRPADMISPEIR